jgi:4-oxalocrotonate tautomerase
MPHAIIKLYAGKSEQQKKRIAEEVTQAIMISTNCGEQSVSVSIQDVKPSEWAETVYKPDIIGNANILYKKPGYESL